MLNKKYTNYEISYATLDYAEIVNAVDRFATGAKSEPHTMECNYMLSELQRCILDFWRENDYRAEILNESIFQALDQLAPDGCYFGAHMSDGSCFGFWQWEDEGEIEI